ncbi:MAG: lysophospholipase [Candidatus Margulisbacteria bacterium]|nr:lysophospholipase [Candidatus Margulisiibacteriota bacterium]
MELQRLEKSDVLYRHWPAPQTKAVLLLVHGLGAHSARWNFFADYFAARGFTCYALELKGFGQTPDRPRGHINSFATYLQDLRQLRQAAEQAHPGKKIYLIGESLGALIAFQAAAREPAGLAGLVLMSPAFANAMKFSLVDYLTLPFFFVIDPRHQYKMPFTAAMCTRDLAYRQVMDNNPDEYRYASAKLLINTLFAQINAAARAKQFRLPVLMQVSGQDAMISTPAAKRTFGQLATADKKLIEYPAMSHALYIDLEREKVYADLLAWLEPRL